ncbi:MAG TPA: ABC transporter permease [Chloroflexota bacterium]|nr:ABC transporter permease [Chloroflexota bacterium]
MASWTLASVRPAPANLAAFERRQSLAARLRGPASASIFTGAILLVCIVLGTIAAPLLSPFDPAEQRPAERLQGPSVAHPFGTDRQGRDQWSRALHGGRTSLAAAGVALTLATTVGVTLGLLAGYSGGLLDSAIMRLVDVVLAFPSFVLGLVVAALFGPALMTVVLAATAFWWVGYARVTRGIVLQVRQEPFVLAARAIGASPGRIAVREVLPHTFGPVLVMATMDVGSLLMTLSGLSFLGMGAQPPTPEWGLMLADGKAYFLEAPHLMLFPGLMIFVTVLAVNLLGDGLRRRVTSTR